jgi:DNA invertase Pin-like site-specific DNA recombinase
MFFLALDAPRRLGCWMGVAARVQIPRKNAAKPSCTQWVGSASLLVTRWHSCYLLSETIPRRCRDAVPSPDHPTIRCAIYTRQSVAHGRDVDFTSCAAQREACELFVRSMRWEGWEILSERFDDVGASGATLDRPALQRLLAAARQGRVDRIVVHRFDRLSRSVLNWVRLAEELRAAEVELSVMAAGSLDVGLATSGLVTNLLAFFGEFERELIRERLRDARAARAARGLRAAGRVPFGYQAHPVTHQLEPHPVEAAVVQDFFRRAAAGETAEAIAASANERGIRTKANRKQRGSCWTGRTVLQLLRSPLYIGMRGAGGEQLPGLHVLYRDLRTGRFW